MPRHIVKLMVDLIDPAYMERVYDVTVPEAFRSKPSVTSRGRLSGTKKQGVF